MNIFKKLWLRLRMTRRIGAFIRARKSGMSIKEARAYSDKLYPPTAEESAYEESLRRKKLSEELVIAARKLAARDKINFDTLSMDGKMQYAERAAQILDERLKSN